MFRMFFFVEIFLLMGCRTTSERPSSEAKSIEEYSVCCAEQDDRGIYYRSAQCKKQYPDQCCGKNIVRRIVTPKRELVGAIDIHCDRLPPEFLSQVEICRGPTRFGIAQPGSGQVIDTAANVSKLAHAWVKIGETEIGMGPEKKDEREAKVDMLRRLTDFFTAKPIREKFRVEWVNHQGFSTIEGARCERLYLCDEQCVRNELVLGKDLGVYSIVNQCHIRAVEVLRKCGCHNHCVETDELTGLCKNRVFPELRGLRLDGDEQSVMEEQTF